MDRAYLGEASAASPRAIGRSRTAMLTHKQQILLDYLISCERTPSYEEMKNALGLKSKSGVHRLIGALEERGFIFRMPNRARAIAVKTGTLAAFSTAELVLELVDRGVIKPTAASKLEAIKSLHNQMILAN